MTRPCTTLICTASEVRIKIDDGCSGEAHDGDSAFGAERYHYRLPRIGHRLKRLVVVGSDGLLTLAALKWLRDQDVSLAFLERNGRVLSVVGPAGSSEAKLRRAQGVAISNGVGLEICRHLIDVKLQGQENVLRQHLNCESTADVVPRFRNKQAQARSAWRSTSLPAWLTEQAYGEKIQPRLTRASSSAIAKHIGVSRWYAGRIRAGYVPHPRHWQARAQLVSSPCQDNPTGQDQDCKENRNGLVIYTPPRHKAGPNDS